MSQYLTVVRKPGMTIHKDYLSRVISKNRVYIGAAAIKDGELVTAKAMKSATVDVINSIAEGFLDSTVLFSFGDVKGILEDDIMPIEILRDKDSNKLLAVVAMDGKFDRHKKTDSSHTGEYHVAKDYLERRFHKWYADGGFDGILKALDDDLNKQDICNLWSNEGSVSFLLQNGEGITVSNREDKKGFYSWGFASDPYGYTEQAPAAPKEEAPKKDDLLSTMLSKAKQVVSGPAPKDGTIVSNATMPPKTETKVFEGLPTGCILEKPDQTVYDTRQKMKGYYESRIGHAPHGFRSGPALIKFPDGKYKLADNKSLENLKTLVSPAADAATHINTERANDAVKEIPPQQSKTVKDVTPHQVKSEMTLPAEPKQTVVSAESLPILSPQVKDRWKEVLKKEEFLGIFGEHMEQIVDPKALRSQIEQKLPNTPQAMGWGDDMSIMDQWSDKQFDLLSASILASGSPRQIMKKMFSDFRNYAVSNKLNKIVPAGSQPVRKAIM
jgi:hypothetical protein